MKTGSIKRARDDNKCYFLDYFSDEEAQCASTSFIPRKTVLEIQKQIKMETMTLNNPMQYRSALVRATQDIFSSIGVR